MHAWVLIPRPLAIALLALLAAAHPEVPGLKPATAARKWRYYYIDSIFKSGTHIVIKNNDRDEFNIEEIATQGFLYAHGDTRTFKRLRANIQQGKPTVMLHNSGEAALHSYRMVFCDLTHVVHNV